MRTYDVAIVGGGIIGASIAFELAATKLQVVVLDRQEPCREASWAAAGMLSPAPDSRRDHPLVPFANHSLNLYPQFIQSIEEASGKSTAYERQGALETFWGADAQRDSQDRLHELCALGITAEQISPDDARRMEGAIAPSLGAALWLPEEGTVNPRALVSALLSGSQNRGVEIQARCAASGLLRESVRCTGVIAGGETIVAGHVILAAGCFSRDFANDESLKQIVPTRPVRGQMVAMRGNAGTAPLRRAVRSERGYLVPRKDGRIVAGSTLEEAGFEKHNTPAGTTKILSAAVEICPKLGQMEIVEMWAGLRPGTPDDLPIVGATELPGFSIATGHYRNGILLAPATARAVRNWIVNSDLDPRIEPFSPLRFSHEASSKAAV